MTFARRAAVVAASAISVVVLSAVFAGAASADVPNGWAPQTNPSALDELRYILFIPLGAAILISLLVLLPGVLRGERFIPTAPKDEVEQPTPFLHED